MILRHFNTANAPIQGTRKRQAHDAVSKGKEKEMEEKHCKWYNDEFCTNDKSPCVADYCPVVGYPELCKCRELDKDINVRSKTEDKRKKILENRIYSDATLKRWKKEDLIEQIRILEYNWACAEKTLDIQAKNCKMILDKISKETAEKFARLVEFHSVSTRDENGREIFTISALGLKEILHEEFCIPYDEICKEIVEGK